MGIYVLVGFMFVVLMMVCCIRCAVHDSHFVRKYQQMVEDHKEQDAKQEDVNLK